MICILFIFSKLIINPNKVKQPAVPNSVHYVGDNCCVTEEEYISLQMFGEQKFDFLQEFGGSLFVFIPIGNKTCKLPNSPPKTILKTKILGLSHIFLLLLFLYFKLYQNVIQSF